MVAKWSGDLFGPPLYDALTELKNIPYLPAQPPFVLRSLTILDVMATDVICFHDIEQVERIFEVPSLAVSLRMIDPVISLGIEQYKS